MCAHDDRTSLTDRRHQPNTPSDPAAPDLLASDRNLEAVAAQIATILAPLLAVAAQWGVVEQPGVVDYADGRSTRSQ